MSVLMRQPQEAGQPRFNRKRNRSQAISEFAILGAIIIAAFGAILAYGQMMNSQQSLQMRAFRKALQESRDEGKVVTYTIVRDNPVYVLNPFSRLDTSRQIASSTVCGIINDPLFPDSDNKDDRGSLEIYEINGNERTVEPIKVRVTYSDGNQYENWVSAPIRDATYRTVKQRTGTLNKREDHSSISTTRSNSATAGATVTLYFEDQDKFEREYLLDLQDEVAPEPWEKKLEVAARDREIISYIDFIASFIASTAICYLGFTCGEETCVTITEAIGAGAMLLTELIFRYALDPPSDVARAVNVNIVGGYRTSESLTGTASLSIPGQTFNVSH